MVDFYQIGVFYELSGNWKVRKILVYIIFFGKICWPKIIDIYPIWFNAPKKNCFEF